MILLASVSLTIYSPIDAFFEYVTDLENYPNWFPGVLKVQRINPHKPSSPGLKYLEIIEFADSTLEQTVEVTEISINKFLVTQGDAQPLLTQMNMNFTPQGKGFLFEVSYYSRQDPKKLDHDMLAVVSSNIAQRAELGMKALKQKFD